MTRRPRRADAPARRGPDATGTGAHLHTLELEQPDAWARPASAPVEWLFNRGPCERRRRHRRSSMPPAGTPHDGYEVDWVPSMRMVVDARRPRRLALGQPHRRVRARVQRALRRPDRAWVDGARPARGRSAADAVSERAEELTLHASGSSCGRASHGQSRRSVPESRSRRRYGRAGPRVPNQATRRHRRARRPRCRPRTRDSARSYEPPPRPSRWPRLVDRQRRSQHRIGPGDRIGAQAWTDGLDQSTGSTGQCVVTGVDRPVQIVVRTQHRQQYPLAEIVEHPEQPSGAGLEADGDVARDNRGTHDLRGAEQPVGDGAGVVDAGPEAGVPGAGRGASSGALPSA